MIEYVCEREMQAYLAFFCINYTYSSERTSMTLAKEEKKNQLCRSDHSVVSWCPRITHSYIIFIFFFVIITLRRSLWLFLLITIFFFFFFTFLSFSVHNSLYAIAYKSQRNRLVTDQFWCARHWERICSEIDSNEKKKRFIFRRKNKSKFIFFSFGWKLFYYFVFASHAIFFSSR